MSIIVGLASGYIAWLNAEQIFGQNIILIAWMFAGLIVGLFGWLILTVAEGLVAIQVDTRTTPNEGVRRSLKSMLVVFLGAWFIVWLGVCLVDGLLYGFEYGFFHGAWIGVTVASMLGGSRGGLAYTQHYVLRCILYCNKYAPWNYIRFLDYAAERVFLYKVGGGYIFIHRLLMEHFAALEPINQTGQSKTTPQQ